MPKLSRITRSSSRENVTGVMEAHGGRLLDASSPERHGISLRLTGYTPRESSPSLGVLALAAAPHSPLNESAVVSNPRTP